MVVVDLTPDLSVTQGNHLICHMLYGVIVSHDDDGVLIFAVDLFDQLQDLLGGFIIQSPCRLIAKKNVRILTMALPIAVLCCLLLEI